MQNLQYNLYLLKSSATIYKNFTFTISFFISTYIFFPSMNKCTMNHNNALADSEFSLFLMHVLPYIKASFRKQVNIQQECLLPEYTKYHEPFLINGENRFRYFIVLLCMVIRYTAFYDFIRLNIVKVPIPKWCQFYKEHYVGT